VNWLTSACRASPSRPNADPVRIPGELVLRRKADSLDYGVSLHPSVVKSLKELASSRAIDFLPTGLTASRRRLLLGPPQMIRPLKEFTQHELRGFSEGRIKIEHALNLVIG
jgi:hypothetical protein